MSLFSLHCELASGSVNVRVYSWHWTTDTTAWRGERGRVGVMHVEGGRENGIEKEEEWEGDYYQIMFSHFVVSLVSLLFSAFLF